MRIALKGPPAIRQPPIRKLRINETCEYRGGGLRHTTENPTCAVASIQKPAGPKTATVYPLPRCCKASLPIRIVVQSLVLLGPEIPHNPYSLHSAVNPSAVTRSSSISNPAPAHRHAETSGPALRGAKTIASPA